MDGRVTSKIRKPDQNNQYGYAMTKPLSTGCIKQLEKMPSWKKCNLLLKALDLDNKLGHLFVVDIDFNAAEADTGTFMDIEVYTPIFEKKVIDPTKRSVFQLSETPRKNINKKPFYQKSQSIKKIYAINHAQKN